MLCFIYFLGSDHSELIPVRNPKFKLLTSNRKLNLNNLLILSTNIGELEGKIDKKPEKKKGKMNRNLRNDIFVKSKMGPAELAAVDLPFQIHHEQSSHSFES